MTKAEGSTVRVWLKRPSDENGDDGRPQPSVWLDAAETQRWRSFAFAQDRRMYLVAHELLRWGLSAAAPGIRPEAWRFRADGLGRPTIASPARGAGLTFSLSHTSAMTAVAISSGGGLLGIDVETVRPPGDQALEAAASYFAPEERRWLDRQSRRNEAVLRLWTLKEAYAKARGLGLSLPLDSFAFVLDSHRGVLRFVPPSDDQAGPEWHFFEAATHTWRLAVACRTRGATRSLRVQVGMPLAGWARWRALVLQRDRAGWKRV